MKIRESVNKYNTPISIHICEYCGNEFTICPLVPDDKEANWRGCLAPNCESYDPERDVDKLLGDGKVKLVKKEIHKEANIHQ